MHSRSWGTEAEMLGSLMMLPSWSLQGHQELQTPQEFSVQGVVSQGSEPTDVQLQRCLFFELI